MSNRDDTIAIDLYANLTVAQQRYARLHEADPALAVEFDYEEVELDDEGLGL